MLHDAYNWNMECDNQGKLEIVMQKIGRLNIVVIGVSELKWSELKYFQSDDYKVFNLGNDKLRRNQVTLILRQDAT